MPNDKYCKRCGQDLPAFTAAFCIHCRVLAAEMQGEAYPMPDVEAMERYAEGGQGEQTHSGIRCADFLRRRRAHTEGARQ